MSQHAYSEDQLVEQPAIGLFAAIPAVIAYNRFSNEVARFANKLEDFSTEFDTILSRQLDS